MATAAPTPTPTPDTVSMAQVMQLLQQQQSVIDQLRSQIAGVNVQAAPPPEANVLADVGEALGDFERGQWFPHNLVTRDPGGNATHYSVFGRLLSHLGVPDAILVSMPIGQAIDNIAMKYDIPTRVLTDLHRFEHIIGFDRAVQAVTDAAGSLQSAATQPGQEPPAPATPPTPSPSPEPQPPAVSPVETQAATEPAPAPTPAPAPSGLSQTPPGAASIFGPPSSTPPATDTAPAVEQP